MGIDTAAACISPVIGAAAAAFPMPAAEPVLLALAAEILAQVAGPESAMVTWRW